MRLIRKTVLLNFTNLVISKAKFALRVVRVVFQASKIAVCAGSFTEVKNIGDGVKVDFQGRENIPQLPALPALPAKFFTLPADLSPDNKGVCGMCG